MSVPNYILNRVCHSMYGHCGWNSLKIDSYFFAQLNNWSCTNAGGKSQSFYENCGEGGSQYLKSFGILDPMHGGSGNRRKLRNA